MRNISIFAICIFLTGCGLSAQQKQKQASESAIQQAKAAMGACESKYPRGTKQYVEKARCQNDATNIVRPFMPYPDLVDQDTATRMAIAEKLQQGKLSEADANMQFTQAHSQIIAEEQRRQLNGRAVHAQESAAAAAWQASSPVSCTSIGATTTCY